MLSTTTTARHGTNNDRHLSLLPSSTPTPIQTPQVRALEWLVASGVEGTHSALHLAACWLVRHLDASADPALALTQASKVLAKSATTTAARLSGLAHQSSPPPRAAAMIAGATLSRRSPPPAPWAHHQGATEQLRALAYLDAIDPAFRQQPRQERWRASCELVRRHREAV